MANLCICCGNKNNSFSGDPLYLEDNKILCSKCAQPIRNELNELFYVKTQEEFDKLVESIIGKSKTIFNETTVQYICHLINNRRKNSAFSITETDLNNIPAINNTFNITEDKTIMNNSNSTGMFNNIGGKIKGLAKASTIIGILVYIVIGIIMLCIDDDLAFAGILIIIIGAFLSWISSFILYGFGQLIENSDILVKLFKYETLSK